MQSVHIQYKKHIFLAVMLTCARQHGHNITRRLRLQKYIGCMYIYLYIRNLCNKILCIICFLLPIIIFFMSTGAFLQFFGPSMEFCSETVVSLQQTQFSFFLLHRRVSSTKTSFINLFVHAYRLHGRWKIGFKDSVILLRTDLGFGRHLKKIFWVSSLPREQLQKCVGPISKFGLGHSMHSKFCWNPSINFFLVCVLNT